MSHIQIIVLGKHVSRRKRPSQIPVHCQSVIERTYLRKIHTRSRDVEYRTHSLEKGIVCQIHLSIGLQLSVDVLLSLLTEPRTVRHQHTVFEQNRNRLMTQGQTESVLVTVRGVAVRRKVVLGTDNWQLRTSA